MAKIPPGVGPRFPQVVALLGATGNLARRQLLPGLFHLAAAGFIAQCRVIGVSLDDIDLPALRQIARSARDQSSARTISDATGTLSPRTWTTCRCRLARRRWLRPWRQPKPASTPNAAACTI